MMKNINYTVNRITNDIYHQVSSLVRIGVEGIKYEYKIILRYD